MRIFGMLLLLSLVAFPLAGTADQRMQFAIQCDSDSKPFTVFQNMDKMAFVECSPGEIYGLQAVGQGESFSVEVFSIDESRPLNRAHTSISKGQMKLIATQRARHDGVAAANVDGKSIAVSTSDVTKSDLKALIEGDKLRTRAHAEAENIELITLSNPHSSEVTTSDCCVTCGSTTACGDAVELDCGSCCTDCENVGF